MRDGIDVIHIVLLFILLPVLGYLTALPFHGMFGRWLDRRYKKKCDAALEKYLKMKKEKEEKEVFDRQYRERRRDSYMYRTATRTFEDKFTKDWNK